MINAYINRASTLMIKNVLNIIIEIYLAAVVYILSFMSHKDLKEKKSNIYANRKHLNSLSLCVQVKCLKCMSMQCESHMDN